MVQINVVVAVVILIWRAFRIVLFSRNQYYVAYELNFLTVLIISNPIFREI